MRVFSKFRPAAVLLPVLALLALTACTPTDHPQWGNVVYDPTYKADNMEP